MSTTAREIESADIDLLIGRSHVMENSKSKGSRRGNNRRRSGVNKENKMREIEKIKKSRSEESIMWNYPVSSDNESKMDIVEQEAPVDLENFDNGELSKRFVCSFPFFSYRAERNYISMGVNSKQMTSCELKIFASLVSRVFLPE